VYIPLKGVFESGFSGRTHFSPQPSIHGDCQIFCSTGESILPVGIPSMPVDSKISCLIGESVLPGDSENPQIRLAPNLCTTNGRCPSRLLPCLYRLCARYEQVRLFVSRLYFVSACVGCDGSKFKEIIWSYAVRTGILGTTMRVGRLKCESL